MYAINIRAHTVAIHLKQV